MKLFRPLVLSVLLIAASLASPAWAIQAITGGAGTPGATGPQGPAGPAPTGNAPQIVGYSAANTVEAETVSGAGDCGTATFSRAGANSYVLTTTCLSSNGNAFTSAAFGATLNLSTPPAIGGGTPAAGTFTTLSSTAGATTSAAFGTALNLTAPPAIGGTTEAAGNFSVLRSGTGCAIPSNAGDFSACRSSTVGVFILGGGQVDWGASSSGTWNFTNAINLRSNGVSGILGYQQSNKAGTLNRPVIGIDATGTLGTIQIGGAGSEDGINFAVPVTTKGYVFATGTASATPGATPGCTDTTVAVSSVTTAMTCKVSPVGAPAGTGAGNLTWACYPTAGNINIRLCTIVTLTAAATTYNYVVVN